MTTQPHEFQPRETDGKFGTKPAPEGPQLALVDGATDELLPWQRRFNDSNETIESLVVRATNDGGFTEAARQDDVEATLREQLNAVDQETFDAGFDRIAKAAEQLSIAERCYADPWDTEAYEPLMAEAGIEPVEISREDAMDWEPGDGSHDWKATHEAVVEHYDSAMFAATFALCEADEAARS